MSPMVELELFLHHMTEKAYLVSDEGDEDRSLWLPKSKCFPAEELEPEDLEVGEHCSLMVPEWLAEQEGLI